MGKASQRKKAKKAAATPGGAPPSDLEEGDLSLLPDYLERFLAGDEEVLASVLSFGRDAAGYVQRVAREKNEARLTDLSRRLVASPPRTKTNLLELRAESIDALIDDALESAPPAGEVVALGVPGAFVAFFDPRRVQDVVVRGGKVRRDAPRIGAGDLAFFAAESAGPLQVTTIAGPPPAAQPVVQARLVVDSGVVFVGPPEASDGPRLGELRLDPFRTGLHENLSRGSLVRWSAGVWQLSAYRTSETAVRVHFEPHPAPDAAPGPFDLLRMVAIPAGL